MKLINIFAVLLVLTYFGYFYRMKYRPLGPDDGDILSSSVSRSSSGSTKANSPFIDSFAQNYILEESGSMKKSSSSNWWLNSGGQFFSKAGIASTIIGDLPIYSPWYLAYKTSSSVDTDGGLHPQNIFRLVTRNKWENFAQSVYFRIVKDNLSISPNRNESNGLFLFNRYQDGQNIYYTGIRVDGGVVIKKKINGSYFTMAYKKYFSGGEYNKDSNPNLLPKNNWIGLKSIISSDVNKRVNIKIYLDVGKTGNWVLVLESIDDGKSFGGNSILSLGFAGIRTDFMDVEFSDYKIEEME